MTLKEQHEWDYYKDITAIRESLEKISKSLALLTKVVAALPTIQKVGYAPKAAQDSKKLIDELSK